jgi:hypothetical protein
MGRTYDAIDEPLAGFLRAQHVFFVGTAPAAGGHVNVSPKGLDTFAVVGARTVAYLDLTGSGVETIAHLRENGRITLLFCAFEGPPRIVRLYGRGRPVVAGDAEFAALATRFPTYPGMRAVIEGLLPGTGAFVRTPKRGDSPVTRRFRAVLKGLPGEELLLAAWFGWGLYAAAENGLWASLPFLLLFFASFLWVWSLSLRQWTRG